MTRPVTCENGKKFARLKRRAKDLLIEFLLS